MTIASERSKVVYQGNGSTREFVVPFHYTRTEDLEVVLRGEDGTERILLHGSEYVMQQGEDEYGGTCVLGTAPQPGEALSVRRDPPILQETAYEEGVPLSARARENALDLLTMIAQANRERVDRALMLPVSSTHKGLILPEPEARRTLVWSPDGTGLENGPSVEAVGAAQEAAQTALDAAGDSQAARDAALSAQAAAETARDEAQAAAVHEHAFLTERDAPDSHPIAAITGLQAALNGKSATGHTHTVAQITNAGTAATRDVGTAPGNVPVLDAEGKLAEGVLPKVRSIPFQEHGETFFESGTLEIPAGGRWCRVIGIGGGRSRNVMGGESSLGTVLFFPGALTSSEYLPYLVVATERGLQVAIAEWKMSPTVATSRIVSFEQHDCIPASWAEVKPGTSYDYVGAGSNAFRRVGTGFFGVRDIWLDAGNYPVTIGAAGGSNATPGAITVLY
jgi:hypothetical protein